MSHLAAFLPFLLRLSEYSALSGSPGTLSDVDMECISLCRSLPYSHIFAAIRIF